MLKAEFLLDRREPDPDGREVPRPLPGAVQPRRPADGAARTTLYEFANSDTVANAGNMSGFNRAWKTQGPDKAAQQGPRDDRVPALRPREPAPRGPADPADRRQEGPRLPVVNKEPLLTKVLCVVEPERFLPVLRYSAPTDGKKEIAKLVFDLDLPPAEKTAWTIGRAGRLEQRPAALAGRQRHPRPAAGDAVPEVGAEPPGPLPHLRRGGPAAAERQCPMARSTARARRRWPFAVGWTSFG